jgi:hypothetical protein
MDQRLTTVLERIIAHYQPIVDLNTGQVGFFELQANGV